MQVGVGLPATVPGTAGSTVVEWARRADAGPYGSVGVLDRLLYDNFEPLTSLAAAAAVTTRVLLAATIVIAPLRRPALLAKQAATIQALSGGRLVLGLGLGAREDDYVAAGSEYRTRGAALTETLAWIRDQWEDERIGPRAGRTSRPRVLVGGGGPAATRMARYADGYAHGGGPPRAFARAAAEARAAWEDFGRPGRPEFWGMAYFQFGSERDRGQSYLRDYYAFTGPFADRIAAGLITDRAMLADLLDGYEEAGCDHLILFPTDADLSQLDTLTQLLERRT